MSAQVIPFRSRVQRVIDHTQNEGLQSVIVIGIDRDGRFYTDAAEVNNAETAYLLALAYWHLMLRTGHE